ncbi:hypothetical protein [Burkholderia cepacia]|uniref:hypothetical protein n=1 Tax=Burkholderia cepacia TaxID=292 RepID=UPI002FE33731
MRFTIKKFGVVVCAALGLVTAAFAMWHGHYWSAVGLLIAGLMMGTQCLLGFDCIKNTTLGFVGTILFVASSWAAVVTESPGFDIEGQTIKVAVAMAALKADAESHWHSPELQQAAKRAGMICMLEGGALDQMDAVTAGGKAIYYGPGATLADAATGLTQRKPDEPDCLTTFRKLYAADPSVFQDITNEHKTWLRVHEIGT